MIMSLSECTLADLYRYCRLFSGTIRGRETGFQVRLALCATASQLSHECAKAAFADAQRCLGGLFVGLTLGKGERTADGGAEPDQIRLENVMELADRQLGVLRASTTSTRREWVAIELLGRVV